MHISQKMKSSELCKLNVNRLILEYVFLLVHLSGKKLIFDIIYRPPNSDIDAFLSKLFEVLTSIMQLDSSGSSIMMGDNNIEILEVSANTLFMENCTIMT